ncbi:MAG: sulfatase-like hydrolase/transferase [Acidobacteria bacterium]|nr:sulfatase-like hydrolase/transferase [Acidobacteriota bacterium]
MNRRNFLATSFSAFAAPPKPPKPNILFILADDLGWGDLSCYGNRRCRTPNLDRLASQGVVFSQFYVNGSVCSPSRTAFTTGHFPARHRMHGHLMLDHAGNEKRAMPDWLDPETPTLARSLQRAGYATAHFGKWHLGNTPDAPLPGKYGFDHHMSVSSSETRWKEMDAGFRARSTAWIVDNALDFIGKQKSQPFYAQLWTLLPHAPLAPTEEQLAPFANLQPGPHVPYKGAWQIYNASLKNLDDELGRLFARLEEMGQADNTLVLFSSDNGPEDIHIVNAAHSGVGSPGPFRGRKRSLYEGGVRLPLIARWPGRIAPGRVDATSVLSAVDFAPTLTRVAGAEALPKPDGEEMNDVLEGQPRPRRTDLYWEWRFQIAGYYQNRSPILSLRSDDHKLLMNPDRSRLELYDIPRDPGEAMNLAAAQPKRVEAMAAKALAWQKQLPPGPMDAGAGSLDYPWPTSAAAKAPPR